jgi:biopolymer transport protein ExbB/TolQ
MLMGNSLWHIIRQTDAVSQLVMAVLLIDSIICWTIFFAKVFLFYFKKRDLKQMINRMQGALNFESIAPMVAHTHKGFGGSFVSTLFATMKNKSLTAHDKQTHFEEVNYAADQLVDVMMTEQESYLPFISTSAAVGPLLGLFGTVWGLIHAFIGISETQAADIATVAPGIAEALTTTLAGLIVAIPALVMFNYLLVELRAIEQQLLRLRDQLMRLYQYSRKEGGLCIDFKAAEKELPQ